MQCGLIDYRARQEGLAVVFKGDGQAPKPLGPLSTQMALDPDLIDRRLIGIRCHCLALSLEVISRDITINFWRVGENSGWPRSHKLDHWISAAVSLRPNSFPH